VSHSKNHAAAWGNNKATAASRQQVCLASSAGGLGAHHGICHKKANSKTTAAEAEAGNSSSNSQSENSEKI